MCNNIMRINPAVFYLIPDHFKTQGMCIKAVAKDPRQLYHAPDYFKMCGATVMEDPWLLNYVPDWFVT